MATATFIGEPLVVFENNIHITDMPKDEKRNKNN
jgi:hypothetical protein